jgi:LCP family protein required for cell wall assembly
VHKSPRRRSLRPVKLLRRPTKPLLPNMTPAHMAAQRVLAQANNWRTYIILVTVILLIGLSGTAFVVLRRTDQALSNIQQSDPRTNPSENNPTSSDTGEQAAGQEFVPATLNEPFTVLLVGVDKRAEAEAEGVRSDTLILVRVEPMAGWATMLSIPRDSVVQLPNGNYGKVNGAYSYGYYHAEDLYGAGTSKDAGGGAAAAETLERFLKVKVDYIAQVDFDGFANLIDSINGIVIDVKAALVDPEFPTENHGVERIYIPPGIQHMDGKTALVYARSRHSSNDFDRSKRQQQVLKAVLSSVRSRGLLANVSLLPNWITVLEKNVRTTLPLADIRTMTDLAGIAAKLDTDKVAQMSINPLDVRVDNVVGSDIYWNSADVAAMVKRWQSGAGISGVVNIQVLNGTTIGGLAAKVTTNLNNNGFSTLEPGDGNDTMATILYDTGDNTQARQKLIDTLGLGSSQVVINSSRPAGSDSEATLVLVIGNDYNAAWAGSAP